MDTTPTARANRPGQPSLVRPLGIVAVVVLLGIAGWMMFAGSEEDTATEPGSMEGATGTTQAPTGAGTNADGEIDMNRRSGEGMAGDGPDASDLSVGEGANQEAPEMGITQTAPDAAEGRNTAMPSGDADAGLSDDAPDPAATPDQTDAAADTTQPIGDDASGAVADGDQGTAAASAEQSGASAGGGGENAGTAPDEAAEATAQDGAEATTPPGPAAQSNDVEPTPSGPEGRDDNPITVE